ncbi:hypothetical protein [Mucilaginibacter sp. HD30]
MPEDEGVNGDQWNDEAAVLLTKLNWKQVGDANIDVVNEDGKRQGIDRMFQFEDVRRASNVQGVFVEAKRYATTSFKKDNLELWIKTLDRKLNKTRNSEKFHETYPSFASASLRTGVIVMWFHDLEHYPTFRKSFYDTLSNIKISGHTRGEGSNKIYVLNNDDILRIASLVHSCESFEPSNKHRIKFYYPSSDRFNNPADRSDVLSLDYIYSKFILAESRTSDGTEHKIVFYFGSLSINAFRRLKNALQSFGYIDKAKPLTIYTYERDTDFRKIKSTVIQEFEGITFKLVEMEIFNDLPAFLRLD